MTNLKNQIVKMDKKSVEFFEVYKQVSEKYWDIDKPDADQRARMLLQSLANRGDNWHCELMVMLANELFKIVEQGHKASHGSFGVKGKDVHFDFYTDKSALSNLEKMLRNSVLLQSKKEGEPKVDA